MQTVESRPPGRRRVLTRLADPSGQAFAETVISLTFVTTLVLGLIFLALLASTKHVVNYAAFAGARASMYGSSEPGSYGQDQLAVREVVRMMFWGRQPVAGRGGGGYRVVYPTPFAFPLIHHGRGTVDVTGVAPTLEQNIPERGDNARP